MANEGAHVDVVVGTYEELILGYQLLLDPDNVEFTQNFTNHNHTGCIKSVALSPKGILASGGTDETIWLFNLRKKNEIGSLVQHSGSITCLEFYKSSHLFSTSEDARVCVWKSFSWECLKTFKGHTGCITSFSIHPSGKLALTVGKDRRLHTWNLIKGRSAYVTNIKQPADIVVWSTDGTMYLIVFDNRIDFYKVETAAVFHSVKTEKRINAVVFLRSDLVAYGGEGGVIVLYNVNEKTEVDRIDTETVRIRDLVKLETSNKKYPLLLFSASSDGYIRAYTVTLQEKSAEVVLLASHNTKFRLTCLAAAEIRGPVKIETEPSQDSGVDVKHEDDSDVEIKEEDVSSDDADLHEMQKESSDDEVQEESSDDDVEVQEESSDDDVEVQEESSDDDVEVKEESSDDDVEVKEESSDDDVQEESSDDVQEESSDDVQEESSDDDNENQESSSDEDHDESSDVEDQEESSDDDVEILKVEKTKAGKIALKEGNDKSGSATGKGRKRRRVLDQHSQKNISIAKKKKMIPDLEIQSFKTVQKKSEGKKISTRKLKKQLPNKKKSK